MKKMQNICLAVFVFLWLLPADASALNRIVNVRHWVAPDHTRIVIDTEEEPKYTLSKTEKTITLDFPNMVLIKAKESLQILNKPGIKKILITPLPNEAIRIVLFLDAHTETNVFILKAIEEKPYRVVVDIELPAVEKKETKAREQVRVLKKNRIIVIDPGHGGEAPGAVGKRKTLEKHVVLAISKDLRDALNRQEGYRAYLTRNGDYYVPFKKRLKIAKEYGADLFISIHADAEKSRQARGISVYSLSVKGASSEAARLLAKNENLADVIGGVANGDSNDESDAIILNMFQTQTTNQSRTLGISLLKNLKDVNSLKFNTVQEAPFRVLKSPEISSLLVETGYISNPDEEQMLCKGRYQKAVAEALTRSILQSLPLPWETVPVKTTGELASPPQITAQGTSFLLTERSSPPPAVLATFVLYRVKRGDTVEGIARKVGTSPDTLRMLNRMKRRDAPGVGRYLRVPLGPSAKDPIRKAGSVVAPAGGKQIEKAKNKPQRYTVKKGDTLADIAAQFNLTLVQLKEANHWRPQQRLLSGQKLIIPTLTGTREDGDTGGKSTTAASATVDRGVYIYKVKKGESLARIAVRFQTDVETLRQLNGLKPNRPLYVDQKLKLPWNPSMSGRRGH